MRRALFGLLSVLLFAPALYAFDGFPLRDDAVAGRYAQWAIAAMERGEWPQALAALERAADFSDVSSDISYLLARARSNQGQSRRAVLQALDQALYLNRWNMFNNEAGRLFRAQTLIEIRDHQEALTELSRLGASPQQAVLTLRAVAASRPWEFFTHMAQVLDIFPRETAPVRVFFDFLNAEHRAGRLPSAGELQLLELVLRRLPALLDDDGELAWMAAPFIWDMVEAARLILAYRATHDPSPQSLPAALRLGVIGEQAALEELFATDTLDRSLLDDVRELLQGEDAIAAFGRNLSAFSGVITEDADRDGIPETFAEYVQGMLVRHTYDPDQDAEPDLTVYFEGGQPVRALSVLPGGGAATIRWERFPAVLEVELDGVQYIPRPFDFHHSPFLLDNVWDSGLLFPERDRLTALLTRRVLVFNSLQVQRPSREFRDGVEIVELRQGVPVRAREYVGGLLAAETEFLMGRPQFQRVDLTLSGRMDTLRRFSSVHQPMELEELWDYHRDIVYTVSGVERLYD